MPGDYTHGFFGPYSEEFFNYPADCLKAVLLHRLSTLTHNMGQLHGINDINIILEYEKMVQQKIYTERALRRVVEKK